MSTELATRKEEPQIISILKRPQTRDELALVVPPGVDIEMLISKAKLAIFSNSDLMKCTPQSVLLAVKKSVSCGLELDGRNCHLVPFGAQCTFIVDWKGYVALGLRCGLLSIFAEIVHSRDTFRVWVDEHGKHLIHEINHREPRGEVLGAYCQTLNTAGVMDWEWMSLEQIKAVQTAKGKGSPWKTDWSEMARKTVIRRHSKRWDIDTRFKRALADDDDRLPEIEPPIRAKMVFPDDVGPATAALPESLSGEVVDFEPAESLALEDAR